MKRVHVRLLRLLVSAIVPFACCPSCGGRSANGSPGDLRGPDGPTLGGDLLEFSDEGRELLLPDSDQREAADLEDLGVEHVSPRDLVDGETLDLHLSEVDGGDLGTNPFPEQPVLCGYQLEEGEYPYGNEYHVQEGFTTSYDPATKANGVAFYPKRMWLLPDGKTLRVAVLWLNGIGISVGNASGSVLAEHAYSTYCWKPVPTVLPTGFIYWDIDTYTDTVTFLGETVLAPHDYGPLLYGGPFLLAATQFDVSGIQPWTMEVPVGDDIYRFYACKTFGQRCQQDSYPGSGTTDSSWEDAALLGQLDPPTRSAQWMFDIIFSRREIWTLRRFGPDGALKHAIPLPVSVHQLPEEKILRSGCDCKQAVPSVDWACAKEGPYMCGAYFSVEPNYESCRCNGGTLADMPPPDEQKERLCERIYYTQFEGDNGLFTMMHIGVVLSWQQFPNIIGELCNEMGTGTIESWPALSSPDQTIWLGNISSGSAFFFPDECAKYSTMATDPFSPGSDMAFACYDRPNSLCPGVRTCVDLQSVDWSFQGLVKYRYTRVVATPDVYPDATEFMVYSGGVDPRVPCDFEARQAIPLWDW